MIEFSTLATAAIDGLTTQFTAYMPAIFGAAFLVMSGFVGLRIAKRGVGAAFGR